MANLTLTPEVRNVLERSTITASSLQLPAQLERKLYEAVNKVITYAGGKWNRSAQAHVFSGDPRVKLGLTLATGVAVDEKQLFQFFPTPPALAARAAQRLHADGDCTVLEPSAGHGALAEAVLQLTSPKSIHMIELNPDCLPILKRRGEEFNRRRRVRPYIGGDERVIAGCWQHDFLQIDPPSAPIGIRRQFDRIIMNPPFTKKQDLQHVAHAVKHWLKPGGRLVAIMAPRRNQFGECPELEAALGEMNNQCSWTTEEIAAGEFKSSGTGIATMLLVLEKSKAVSNDTNPLAAAVVTMDAIGQAIAECEANLQAAPEPDPQEVDVLRADLGVSWDLIENYDPAASVHKCGDKWNYTTMEGRSCPLMSTTKREAVAAAQRHLKLKHEMYERPHGYRNIDEVRARNAGLPNPAAVSPRNWATTKITRAKTPGADPLTAGLPLFELC